MDFPEFLRLFEVRAPNLMWFLGAGCSITAGIPSAHDIIWDCKSRIYCSEHGVPRSIMADISSPQIQNIIQNHLVSKNVYPANEEDGDEYTYYFEKAFASKTDRRTYIKELVSRASPSYGHLILASLSKVEKAPIIWTTNFDKLYEDAAYEVFGSSNELVVADLGEPEKAVQSLDAKSYPLLVKLHGDFHSERLKNTKPELQNQDEKMREALKKACSNYGLCTAGYSGRDKSVMDVLKASASDKGNFPHGIFWFYRAGAEPVESVSEFLDLARKNEIEAHLVEINTFDEALDSVRRYLGTFPDDIEDLLKPKASRKTDAPINPEAKNPPYLRMNALRVESAPTMCKLINCDIGGYKDIANAIEQTKANILARRIRRGVIAFGADHEIKKAFANNKIKSMEIYAIDPEKLSFASEEYNLIFDALCKSVERKTGLTLEDRRTGKYLVANENVTPPNFFNRLTDCAVSVVKGTVPSTTVEWCEACKIDLDYKFNKLWVILSPRVLLTFTDQHSDTERNQAKSFVRERTAPRRHPSSGKFIGYNPIAASILAGWIEALSGQTSTENITLSTLGLSDGLDPRFEISMEKVISGRSR